MQTSCLEKEQLRKRGCRAVAKCKKKKEEELREQGGRAVAKCKKKRNKS